MNPKGSNIVAYEPPKLVPIGNLRDVVAGTTQFLNCDSLTSTPGTDGDHNTSAANCLAGG